MLSRPFIPDASDAMLAALRLDARRWPADAADGAGGAARRAIAFDVPEVLFAKIDDARRAELEARFAGAG